MANSDAAFGLRPVGNMAGAPHTGGVVKVAFEDENAVATFIGDLVRLEGGADTDGNPTVDRCVDEDTDAFGVIVGFVPLYTNLENKYRLASTARTAYCVPAIPGQLFEIQADGAVAATDVGNVAQILDTATGNTTTGVSLVELAVATIGSGTNLRIERLVPRPDNDFSANAKVIVSIAEHSHGGDMTGV